VNDCDPMIATPVPRWFYTGNARQLDKPIRGDSCAEPPPFWVAGFEIGELLATDRVDKKIARLGIESLCGAGKSATELLQLRDIHERSWSPAELSGRPARRRVRVARLGFTPSGVEPTARADEFGNRMTPGDLPNLVRHPIDARLRAYVVLARRTRHTNCPDNVVADIDRQPAREREHAGVFL
jgi:hypothetical protein